MSTLLRPIRTPACRKRPIPARHLANDPGTRVIFSVGLGRRAVEAHFDERRRQLAEQLDDAIRHQHSVAEHGDEQAALLGVPEDLGEIGTHHGIPARYRQVERARLDHLVHERHHFARRHLRGPLLVLLLLGPR